jgi:hypothetical protein
MSERNKGADVHILAAAFFDGLHIDDCEYGGIGLDPKRPFGNSDVDGDILEMIGAEPEGDDGDSQCWSSDQRDYARSLYHEELIPYLREIWAEFKAS